MDDEDYEEHVVEFWANLLSIIKNLFVEFFNKYLIEDILKTI